VVRKSNHMQVVPRIWSIDIRSLGTVHAGIDDSAVRLSRTMKNT